MTSSTTQDSVPGLLDALPERWEAEAHRYQIYAEGSSLPEMHLAIAKTLRGVAEELRVALAADRDELDSLEVSPETAKRLALDQRALSQRLDHGRAMRAAFYSHFPRES